MEMVTSTGGESLSPAAECMARVVGSCRGRPVDDDDGNDVDYGEASEHDEAPEPCELLDPSELEVVKVYQTESRPKQCLCCLP